MGDESEFNGNGGDKWPSPCSYGSWDESPKGHGRGLDPATKGLGANSSDEELEVGKGDNHVAFRSPFTTVYTRLIEGPYPPYDQVIPRDNDKWAIVDKTALSSALRRMSVIASDQTHRIRMTFNAGILRFSVQTPDLGEAQDELAVRYTGDPLDIGFNASYLLEMLRYMPTEEVKMTFKAPERAATMEPENWTGEGEYMCLVMPLRLVD